MDNVAREAETADTANEQADSAADHAGPRSSLPLPTRIRQHLAAWLTLTSSAHRPTAPAPSSAARPTARLLLGHFALAVAIAGTTALLVFQLRNNTLAKAEHELRNTSILLADQAERAFEAVDLVELGLAERLHDSNLRTREDFRQRLSGSAVHEELLSRAETLPQLDAVSVMDSEGTLLNSSYYWPIPELHYNNRDYFEALKSDPAQTTFIGVPVRFQSTGLWTIFLARKITAPDHTFLGVVVAGLPLSFFEDLYRQVGVNPDIAISMFRQDGFLLARYPHIDAQIGQSFGKPLAFAHPNGTSLDTVVLRKTGLIDGREKLIASKSLLHYPLAVNVLEDVSVILAEWWNQAAYIIAVGVLLELVAAGVGVLMQRQLRSQLMLEQAQVFSAKAEAELLVAHERERSDREMRVQNLRFGAALSNMTQALVMFDRDNRLVVANGRLSEMLGVPASTIALGIGIDELVVVAERSNLRPVDSGPIRRTIRRLTAGKQRTSSISPLANGSTLSVNYVPLEDNGWLVTLEDITDQQAAKARITHMAHHDALTGLPNRVLFQEKLAEAAARTGRGELVALLYLDLDHFKSVNDTLGHPIGDGLLQAVTGRIAQEIRKTDTLARLGGDEFAIIQSNIDEPDDAAILSRRLIDALSAPFELANHQVVVGTSIGIAIMPTDGADPYQILKNADLALYRAKSDGRGRYRFFEPEMDALMQARRAMEIDLRKGLAAEEFAVFYQPLMDLKTGSVVGFEALLRWFHPQRGLISPGDFIPLAEEIGLLVPLGEWVLRRACFDASGWPGNIKVAVNVSVTQFASRSLVEDVAAALHESGLAPSRLELEITESVMLEDTEAVLRTLNRLRDLGVGIALDDFGTGYSSLSYLRRFPFTKVKIDRSFIEGLGTAGDSDAIVKAVTDLCGTLGMATLAEGVETDDQLQRLRAGNCNEAQGYLFSRPRPAEEVLDLCRILTRSEPIEAGIPIGADAIPGL